MPIEKNQPLTLPILSRKADGSPNSTITPTIFISKDGGAAVALSNSAVSAIENMPGAWLLTLTASMLDCTILTISHSGAGLEFYIQPLALEAAYTAARGGALDKLDATVSSRGTSNFAGGAVASVTGAVGSVTSGVALQSGEYSNISNQIERAGGTLMTTKATVDSVNTTAGQINAKTANLPASPAAVGSAMTLTPGERTATANVLFATEVEPGMTWLQAIRLKIGVLFGKATPVPGGIQFLRRDGVTVALTVLFGDDGARPSSTIGSV